MIHEYKQAPERPTQALIARRLGVTQATVSLALRGSPRISPAMRERVRAEADGAGYRPDPALRALVRRRWREPGQLTFAYLGEEPDPNVEMYYTAARRRCAELGIDLWYLHWPEGEGEDERVQRLLARRRVSGILFGHTFGRRAWNRGWERWRFVHCGMLTPPEVGDVVYPDLAGGVYAAYERLAARGHRSITAMHIAQPFHSDEIIAGALWMLERRIGDRDRFSAWIGASSDEASRWLERSRSDAMLMSASLHLVPGLSRPHAALARWTGRDGDAFAGMTLPVEEVAAYAIDLLIEQVRDQAPPRGVRRMHLIEMRWREGASLRCA
jgi:DNA-binding LacI/PurR family transcriptional regulator